MSNDQSKKDEEEVVIEMREVNKKKEFWTNVLKIGGGLLVGGILVYALGGKEPLEEDALLDTASNDLLGDTMNNVVDSGNSENVE